MSKYIFLNVPAHGHVNPTLAVAQELVRRGEQVIYYLTEEFRAAVEATGATFRPYQSAMGKMRPPAGPMMGKGGIGPGAMPLMMAHESRQVLPQSGVDACRTPRLSALRSHVSVGIYSCAGASYSGDFIALQLCG